MTRKIPELRFAGFSGEWENKSIYKIADVNPKSSELPRIFKYVDLESVKGPFLINYRIENKETAPSRAQRLAKKNDIFFQTVRPYQKNNYLFVKNDEDFVFSTGYAQLRVKENMAQSYVFSYIQTEKFVTNVLNACTGTSYPAISSGDLSKLDIKYPCKKEQEKIGELFETLDACLEDQAAYVETLKKSKKAFLQKLFPQKGAKVPELRFPGFEGDWELKSLSAYFSIPEPIKLDVTDTKQIITVRLKLRGIVQNENDNLKLGATQYYKRKKGQFIYGKQNLFNGAFGIIPENLDGCVSSGDIPAFDIINMDANFIYYFFSRESFYKRLENISSGSGSKRVHEKELLNVKLNLPSLLEQEKIGSFFKALDEKIEKEEDKLKSLERLKLALLQKVFV